MRRLTSRQKEWILWVLLICAFLLPLPGVVLIGTELGPRGVENVSALVLGAVCLVLSGVLLVIHIRLEHHYHW